MSGINIETLNILHAEVLTLVEDVAGYLFNEPLELDPVWARLGQLHGTFRLLDVPAAVMLLDEVHKTVQFLVDKQVSPSVHQVEIGAILDVFPRLVKGLGRIHRTSLFTFMPEMATLRRIQGLPPIYEFQLVKNHTWPSSQQFQGETALDTDGVSTLKKLKQLYQMGLLEVIRGRDQAKGADAITRVANKLQQLLASGAERRYWKLVECVARAFQAGKLQYNPVRLRLLAAVERQLKTLLDNAQGASVKAAYPLGLWRAYAILLALVPEQTDECRATLEWAGGPDFDFTDADITATREVVFEGDNNSLGVTLSEIQDRLGSLHTLLELIDTQSALGHADAFAFSQLLDELAEKTGELGLQRASARFETHASDLEGDSAWQQNVELLRGVAHSLLYVECLILYAREQGVAIGGILEKLDLKEVDTVVEEKLVASSVSAVWSECLRSLSTVKELIDDIVSDLAGEEVVDSLANAMGEIRGAGMIVGEIQVADIAGRCREFVRHRLFEEDSEGRGRVLPAFADAVVALEYFLQNSIHGDRSDFVLAIAEDYLAELSA